MINVYFQHWGGDIRKLQLMKDGSWQGGDSSNIVATDARNATPISAVAYAMDNKATVLCDPLLVHMFEWLISTSGTSFISIKATKFERRSTITLPISGEKDPLESSI